MPASAADTYPTTMPIRAQNTRSEPFVHTLRTIIAPKLTAVTVRSSRLRPAGVPTPSTYRVPRLPSVTPTTTTTKPAISGGKNGRSGRRTRERAASRAPPNSVIPTTSAMPPVLAASREGAMYAEVKDVGQR